VKFSDFVVWDAIYPNLTSTDKPGVIHELVGALCDAGKLPADLHDTITAAVMEREHLGSTGIGRGIAVPHTKHTGVSQPIAAIGISGEGIDFASLDGELAFLFVLLISPPECTAEHLAALEHVSQQLRHNTFNHFLQDAKTVKEVRQLLKEADESGGAAFA